MGEAIVASARDAAFVAAVNGTAGTTANALGAIGSTGISAAALASMAAPVPRGARDPARGTPSGMTCAALLRQALLAAQVQAQQRQRMAALASATAGVGGDVNALINALLGPRDVNQAVDVEVGLGDVQHRGERRGRGRRHRAPPIPPATAAAAAVPGQMPNATTTNPLANLPRFPRARGAGSAFRAPRPVANAPRGVPGGAPAMAGRPPRLRRARRDSLRRGEWYSRGRCLRREPVAVRRRRARGRRVLRERPRRRGGGGGAGGEGRGGGDDEAVAAAAAAFAAMNANTQNAAARNANAQNAVENAGTRGRDSGVSEDTDVGRRDARRHKEGSVRSPRRTRRRGG